MYLGVKAPVPFRVFKDLGSKGRKSYGVNFGFGGTGVFNTSVSFPNMSTQIDLFDNFILKKYIQSSLALVSVSGNDYSFYLARNGSLQVSTMFSWFFFFLLIRVSNHVYLRLNHKFSI